MVKVTNYRELMAEQANATVRISGAHHSSWGGRLGTIDRARETGGVAGWDHTIQYNPRIVDEPLQEMFRNARVHNQDPATLRSYRAALKVMLHENVHLLSSEGRDHRQAQYDFGHKGGVRALEESVTEIYSQQRLNDYIDDLGLDEVAPGIKNARSSPVYKQYLPAAEAFAETIGQRSRLGQDEVIQRMAVVPADQKFRAAAEMMYDNSDLPGLVPTDQRDASINRIAEAMRPAFAEIDKLDEKAPERNRRIIGGRAARNGYSEVNEIRKQWSQPAPEMRQDRGRQTEQSRQTGRQSGQSGPQLPSPQPGGRQGHPGPQAPSEIPAAGVRATGDLQHAMRAGLSGTARMSSAKRLAAGSQGSRSGAPGVSQQKQGPERET